MIEFDRYGYILGTSVIEKVSTPFGNISIQLRRKELHGQIVIEADMYKGGMFRNSEFTEFRAVVHFAPDGDSYRLVESGYNNPSWMELRRIILAVIAVNE